MQAIDMHIHVPREPGLPEIEIEAELLRYFRAPPPPSDPAEMADKFRELDLFGVIFSVDTTTNTGETPDSNDWVASIVNDHPEQFMGFASVDPWMGKAACYELERSVKELGLKGLKLHPIHQAFFPNDTRFYPLYEVADSLGIPVLFHSGFAGAGSGTPGGSGLKLKYSKPVPCFDDVAADFPNLTIIMAHPAWPWIDEQIAVALHKSNVFLDLSGWMPRFIPETLIPRNQHAPARQGDVRLRLPVHPAGQLARRLPEPPDPRPRGAQGAAGKRAACAQHSGITSRLASLYPKREPGPNRATPGRCCGPRLLVPARALPLCHCQPRSSVIANFALPSLPASPPCHCEPHHPVIASEARQSR